MILNSLAHEMLIAFGFCFAVFWSTSCKKNRDASDLAATNSASTACEQTTPVAVTNENLTINIEKPLLRQVYQRDKNDTAVVALAGTVNAGADCIEARVLLSAQLGKVVVGWTKIADANGLSWWRRAFTSTLRVPAGGWYTLGVRAWSKHQPGKETFVTRFGVGEVFIAAGQSNSGNHGTEIQVPHDDRIVAFDGKEWNVAKDPQPLATTDGSKGGSPWPPMADLLIKDIDLPIGILSVGWGGTSVTKWQPGGNLYPRLKSQLVALGNGGARAVLWHQGEADSILGLTTETYKNLLENLITSSRKDAGYKIDWYVARASYLTPQFASREKQLPIHAAQELVISEGFAFAGPDTDAMGDEYRSTEDHVHMNGDGLREHGRRWRNEIVKHIPLKHREN